MLCNILLVFLRCWSFVTCEAGGGGSGGGAHFEKSLEIFKLTPQFIIAFQKWPHIVHIVKVMFHPFAVETTNTLDTNHAKVHHTLFLQWVFMAVTFNFTSCSLLLCNSFMTFIKMTPQVMLPYLKVTPQQNGHTLFAGNK